MIQNEQEYRTTLKRIERFQRQIEELRKREASPENYRLSVGGFLAELDRAVLQVSSTPERFSEHLLGTRRFLFRRFPYLLVYRVLAEQVQVIAVAHGRRRPGYWEHR